MYSDLKLASKPCERLTRQQIENHLRGCPCLPSLGSIELALKELLGADQRYTSQIAEIIRRDPSLTSRLLKLVNSVYYGSSKPIKNIEEAVFFLGVRQIRQLAMVTPIIEDFQKLGGNKTIFPWREFWRHCIGTALMTREVLDIFQPQKGEIDYVAGLIHDVGKIAMLSIFPDHFQEIYSRGKADGEDLTEIERNVLGMDHAELGALYLKKQSIPDTFIEVVRFHHEPEKSEGKSPVVCAVQVADLMVRQAAIGKSGNQKTVTEEDWQNSTGWGILFGHQAGEELALTRASLKRALERVPTILEGIV
jgi:HD-like signal output (HDOD) protein